MKLNLLNVVVIVVVIILIFAVIYTATFNTGTAQNVGQFDSLIIDGTDINTLIDQRAASIPGPATSLSTNPDVLSEIWGANIEQYDNQRFFMWNWRTGKGWISGEQIHGLAYFSTGTTRFWWCDMAISTTTTPSLRGEGLLARWLAQNGTGTSADFGSFMIGPPYNTCKSQFIITPTVNTNLYLSKTGAAPVDPTDPDSFHIRPYTGEAVIYISTRAVILAIPASEVDDMADDFSVTAGTATEVAAIDVAFTVDDLFGPSGFQLDFDFPPQAYTPTWNSTC